MRLRFLKDGKIAGWIWLALYSTLNLAVGIGILTSDAIAARVAKCLAFFIGINGIVLTSYTLRNVDSLKSCVTSILPGKPPEKEDP